MRNVARGVVLAVAAMAATGCATHARAVPITMMPTRALMVHVEIDGKPFVMQVDTGANHSTITPVARRRLGIPRVYDAYARGAGGNIGKVEIVMLHETTIGDRRIHDLPVAVVSSLLGDDRSDGLLGQDVLAHFISELDLRNRRLVLHAADDTAWRTRDLIGVPYTTISGGLIRIDATLSGRPIAVVVDLGAQNSVASSAAAGDQVGIVSGWVNGSDGRDVEVTGLADAQIEVGELRFPAPRFIADLPVFAMLPIYDRPVMILGVDALATRKLVIQPHEQRLYVSN